MGKMDVENHGFILKTFPNVRKTRILGEAKFQLVFFVTKKTMVNPGMIHP